MLRIFKQVLKLDIQKARYIRVSCEPQSKPSKLLEGGYIWDDIVDYYRGYEGDSRSLGYGLCRVCVNDSAGVFALKKLGCC